MSGDQAYTRAELRQRAKDQENPAWLSWLAAMPAALEEFVGKDVPNMPADPWSADGLRRAESRALDVFQTGDAVMLPENRELVDRFHRYVGQVFVRRFEGTWLNILDNPDYLDRGFEPVVQIPFTDMHFAVVPQLTAAMSRRTGEHWARIYGYSEEDYAAWQAAGRPPLADWVALQDNL